MNQMEMKLMNNAHEYLKAEYFESAIPAYQGNPAITCLPNFENEQEVLDALTKLPTCKIANELTSRERAKQLVHDLSNVFIPLPQHVELAFIMEETIKNGYVNRNLNSNANVIARQENYRNVLAKKSPLESFDEVTNAPRSLMIYGNPGDGKTTSMESVLKLFPQVLFHEEFNCLQVVYLKIDFPHDSNLRTLCINFISSLNVLLSTDQQIRFEKKESANSLLTKMRQAAINCHLGVLVIDEFQFWRRSKGNSDEILAFLVSLINTIQVPIVFTGTPEGRGKIEKHLALARRVLGFNIWDPLEMQKCRNNEKYEESDQLWKYFTQVLWGHQYLMGEKVPLTQEISDTWRGLSQGIIDIAVKLFIHAQLKAISSGQNKLSIDLFKRVYLSDFKPAHSLMDALKSNDPETIAQCPDLDFRVLDKHLKSNHQFLIEKSSSKEVNHDPRKIRLINVLLEFGYCSDEILPLVSSLLEKYPHLDAQALFLKFQERFIPRQTKEAKANQNALNQIQKMDFSGDI